MAVGDAAGVVAVGDSIGTAFFCVCFCAAGFVAATFFGAGVFFSFVFVGAPDKLHEQCFSRHFPHVLHFFLWHLHECKLAMLAACN